MNNKRLNLDGMGLEALEGSGDALTIELTGYRTNKAGRHESYVIKAKICRWAVSSFLNKVKEMHERDRIRIACEQRRIEREAGALMVKP